MRTMKNFRSLANSLAQLSKPAANVAVTLPNAAAEDATGPSATRLFSPAGAPATKLTRTSSPEFPLSVPPQKAPEPLSAATKPTPQTSPAAPGVKPANAFSTKVLAIVVCSVLLLLAMTLVLVKILRPRPKTPVALITVHIHATPPGATIRINNEVRGVSDLDLTLPIGSYQIDAQLDGYQTASSTFEARTGAPPGSVDLALQPVLPVVKLTADTGAGKVSFDDQPAVDLDGAQWSADNLTPGAHRLKFTGSQAEASFTFTAEAGSPPAITRSADGKGCARTRRIQFRQPPARVLQRFAGEAQPGQTGRSRGGIRRSRYSQRLRRSPPVDFEAG